MTTIRPTAEQVVRGFLDQVRSGADPRRASRFMADRVLAHQVQSENPVVVERSPDQYAEHVEEMLTEFGRFEFHIDELFSADDRVYVRWVQTGHHLSEIDGIAPTGLPITQFGSAVYRVEDGLIVEYWVQVDRHGFNVQLNRQSI
jgi:predicted ester cyclase